MDKKAHAVEGQPDCDGEMYRYVVGYTYLRTSYPDGDFPPKTERCGPVTHITVSQDLPGLNGNMERVRVFDGDFLVFEVPVASVGGIEYAHN